MAKTKEYSDKPRFNVIYGYEGDFTKSFSQLTKLMNQEIINKATKMVEQNHSK